MGVYKMQNLCFKQGGWLVLLLIATSVTDGRTNDVSVSIVPDSVDSGNSNIEMTCSYPGLGGTNLTGVEWTALGNSMFHYFPGGGSSGPQGDYVGRVTEKDVNETFHTIKMTGTNWCVDLGEYRCDVGSSVGHSYGNATISAVKPEFIGFLCDEEACPDNATHPLDDMKVNCSFLYYRELEVTLDGTNGSQNSGGNLIGQDSCTFRSWATLDFSPEGGELSITCTAKHGDGDTEPHTLMLKFAAVSGLSGAAVRGLSDGEIAGIVIGSVAGIVIIGVVVLLVLKRRGSMRSQYNINMYG